MLLEHLEKEFDFPTVPIYRADSGGAKSKVVSQKLDLPLVLLIPDHYPSQFLRVLLAGLGDGESNSLVKQYVPALRHWMLLYYIESGVAFQPGDEEDAGFIPLPEEIKITVATVHGNYTASGKCKMAGCDYIGGFAISDYGKVW
jgi:hypothetical protein